MQTGVVANQLIDRSNLAPGGTESLDGGFIAVGVEVDAGVGGDQYGQDNDQKHAHALHCIIML